METSKYLVDTLHCEVSSCRDHYSPRIFNYHLFILMICFIVNDNNKNKDNLGLMNEGNKAME